MKRNMIWLLAGLALVLTLAQLGRWFLFRRSAESEASKASDKVVIMVEPGETMAEVARKLKENWVIGNEKLFIFIAEIKGADKRVQPGEYEFERDMHLMEVLDVLVKGRQRYYRLLVAEGLNMWDIAGEVDKIWPGQGERFLSLCRSHPFMHTLGIEADSLEGYLFPETYFVRRFDTVELLIGQMVRNFNHAWKPEYQQRAIDLGYSRREILTIASIIEKEAGLAGEKPLVAAVIYNRMKKEMPLCMDPTVIYGMMPDFDGNLKRSNLVAYTPYNTYQVRGLPPGPICNPGEQAIRAALWPAQVNYLYFVAKNDGSHFFSFNYADHLEAVRLYQHGGGAGAQEGATIWGDTAGAERAAPLQDGATVGNDAGAERVPPERVLPAPDRGASKPKRNQ